MSIPTFTLDGILPPFLGEEPSENSELMSPYRVSASEVVNHFATSCRRREILIGWLKHRRALRKVGIVSGFQWLDGSFLENLGNREPKDLDVMIFFRRPARRKKDAIFEQFAKRHEKLFIHSIVKATYNLDSYFIDLDGNSESIVSVSRYFLQLFSHQRNTFLWKGMLQVRQDDDQEDVALLAQLIADIKGDQP